MAVCRYHPDRPGVGICMRCRSVICTACCTRVAGVNHCHACLRTLAQRGAEPSAGGASTAFNGVVLLCCIAAALFGIGLFLQGSLAP
jgi:hypothetical protein